MEREWCWVAHKTLGKLRSVAPPSGLLEALFLCTKGHTCEKSQGRAARKTLEGDSHAFRSNVAHPIREEG